jgi:hypothetical protein
MSCIVACLTLGNVLTVATHSIEVEIPDESDMNWSIDPQNKQILFRTAFSIKNRGAYDIIDIDINAKLVKENEQLLVTFSKQNMVVLRGSDKTFDIIVTLDLDTISLVDWLSLVYRDSTLQLLIDIDAKYMFGLLEFTVDEILEIPWSPPLSNLSKNSSVQTGIDGVYSLLSRATQSPAHNTTADITDILTLLTMPDLNYTSESGFSFLVTITNYSKAIKNIKCSLTTPLIWLDGSIIMDSSFLVGIEEGMPVFSIQEMNLNYVT